MIIGRTLRDEGTSYHYATPAAFADAAPELIETAVRATRERGPRVVGGTTWTTGEPVWKTAEAAEAARKQKDTWWKLPRYTASRSQLSSGVSVSPV
jgi:hypothetical protein